MKLVKQVITSLVLCSSNYIARAQNEYEVSTVGTNSCDRAGEKFSEILTAADCELAKEKLYSLVPNFNPNTNDSNYHTGCGYYYDSYSAVYFNIFFATGNVNQYSAPICKYTGKSSI